MLPTALLVELFDKQITKEEFERLSIVPGSREEFLHNMRKRPLSIITSTPVSPPVRDPSPASEYSFASTLSTSPPSSSESFWQELECSASPGLSSEDEASFKQSPYYTDSRHYKTAKTKQGKVKSFEVKKYCSFCYNNYEKESVYTSHDLRDEAKNITCPALYEVVCRFCGATGSEAHTPKFCPHKYNRHRRAN